MKRTFIITLFILLPLFATAQDREGQSPWVRYEYFWLRQSPSPTSGVGDIIFNTMTKIIIDRDTSEWAVNAFTSCAQLLYEHKRWPDAFGKLYNGRMQNDMTRDPYIAFGACYSFLLSLEDDNIIRCNMQLVKPPVYLWIFNPKFIIWWHHLKADNRKHFVIRLNYFISVATTNIYEKYYEDDFYK